MIWFTAWLLWRLPLLFLAGLESGAGGGGVLGKHMWPMLPWAYAVQAER
jgi:hypothetical protein